MSQKRNVENGHIPSEGSTSCGRPQDKRPRLTSLRSVICEVIKLQSFQHFLQPTLEPLIRRVVKEEVELAFKRHLKSLKRNCRKESHVSELRSLKVKFLSNPSLPVFTGTRIEGDECPTIKVALVDAVTGRVINSGPESSSKVEIIVLEGDFDCDEEDRWTTDEFKNNIVKEREGKKALLTGDVFLSLNEGVGWTSEISFTDNSSWTRSRKFRLGARVVDRFDGITIREAKSESFIVRDHRGELYKKHHPPYLSDEVWRLEKIGKDGAFHKRLSKENIFTVKDFLILLVIDPPRLRHILGTGMSAKMWEATMEHARTCILDDKRVYLYCSPDIQQKICVVFNVVGQLLGLLSECEYLSVDKLSETQKVDAQNMIMAAFQHCGDVACFEDEASLTGGTADLPSTSPGMESCTISKSSTPFNFKNNINNNNYNNNNFNNNSSKCEGDLGYEEQATSPIFSMGCELEDYGVGGIGGLGVEFESGGGLDFSVALESFVMDDEEEGQGGGDLESALSSFMCSRSRSADAHKRWTVLFGVATIWILARKAAASLRRRRRNVDEEEWARYIN